MAGFVIFIWVFGLALLAFGIVLLCHSNTSGDIYLSGTMASLFGLVFVTIATFVVVPLEFPSGLPKTGIHTGEYKVVFVYVAGDNVNLGVEEVGNDNERLYLYQFPKSAFDSGSMNTQAKKLVVVESGNLRKLFLK